MVSRVLKALFASALLLALCFLGLSYYTGYAGEQQVRQQLELNREQAARQGYNLVLEDYERGLFQSRVALSLTPGNPAQRDGVQIKGALELQHGPWVRGAEGGQLGVFALSADLDSDSHFGALEASLPWQALLEGLQVVGEFGRDYRLHWHWPAFTFSQGGYQWTLGAGELQWRGAYQRLAGEGRVGLAPSKLVWPGQMQLAASESELTFSLAYLQDWSLEGQSRWQAENLTWSGGGQMPVALEQLDWRWQQNVEQARINTDYAMTATRLSVGPISINDLEAQTRIEGFPVAVLQRWEQLSRQSAQTFEPIEWLAAGDESLRQELTASGFIGAKLGQGASRADWRAQYRGLSQVNALTDWQEWLTLLDAELDLKVSESALSSSPLYWLFAEHIDQYLRKDGEQRRFEARWQEGELKLN